jgi:hypothetical protein
MAGDSYAKITDAGLGWKGLEDVKKYHDAESARRKDLLMIQSYINRYSLFL